MDKIPKTRLIRQYIRGALLHFGNSDPANVVETLLIRDGVYCGHRFRQDQHEAVWFVEENQVKFYGPGGELLQCSNTADVIRQDRQQAA